MPWARLDSAVATGNTCFDFNKSRSQSRFAESRDSALVTRNNGSLSIDSTGLRLGAVKAGLVLHRKGMALGLYSSRD